MDKKKLISEFKKLLDDKKITNLLTIALVIAFIILALNVFYPDMFKKEDIKSTLSEDLTNLSFGSIDLETDWLVWLYFFRSNFTRGSNFFLPYLGKENFAWEYC